MELEELSIGEVAERTGLSVHALRFYEREGLLAGEVERGPGGRRIYNEDHVEWLEICTSFRASGMPLSVIREYAALVRRGTGNEEERLALLREHEQRVKASMTDLQKSLDLIAYKVGFYEDQLAGGTAEQIWNPASHGADQPG